MSVWAPKPPKLKVNKANKAKATSENENVEHSATEASLHPSARRPSTTSEEYSQPQAAEAKFTLFQKLPPELRNKIWQSSHPGPRIAKIIHDPKDMAIIEVEGLESGPSPFWRA